MKRYWLFQGYDYYPSGGMNDHVDCYDTKEEALRLVLKDIMDELPLGQTIEEGIDGHFVLSWVQILDSKNDTHPYRNKEMMIYELKQMAKNLKQST